MSKKTYFGSQEVESDKRQTLVNQVFDNSAAHYDLMNDFMSAGIHRYWKKEAISLLKLCENNIVCDVAAGSGDLTKRILSEVTSGKVYMLDINPSMLEVGYNRILDETVNSSQVTPVLANAECLPMKDKLFDRIICSFGIRNMTNMDKALSEFYRCLVPGGRIVILEFSHVESPFFKEFYNFYTSNIIPTIGAVVAGDRESYQYLVESIQKHPKQSEFADMMRAAGFVDVAWKNLSLGAVAIHVGIKI